MITEKDWGYEELIENGAYCMKLLCYRHKGIASSQHYHEHKTETFYVASGEYFLELETASGEKRTELLGQGNGITITPGLRHRIRCVRPGIIVEASTRDDPADCVRLVPSEKPR